MFGAAGRIGVIVPANNGVLEPELWSALPAGTALYATRILARGELTPAAVHAMEANVDRAVDKLAATGVDVIIYADMVTTFIMEPGWNEARTEAIAARTGRPCISAWTALRDALARLGVARFALGTPYPRAIHALAPPFFAARGLALTDDATLDILRMEDVPRTDAGTLRGLVAGLDVRGAEAVVLLATDLPTFESLEPLAAMTGRPVLSSNQTILWSALRTMGNAAAPPGLGPLFRA